MEVIFTVKKDEEYIPGNDPSKLPRIDTSHMKRRYMDLPYAQLSPAQKLDLYLPEDGEGPFPLLIHIRGGAFAIGDKCDIQLRCLLTAVERGYALASINYRLSGEAVFPAPYHDCKAAVRWLRQHAPSYGIDPERFGVIGGSAGGTLSAMLATTGDVEELEGAELGCSDQSSRVQCCVDWFGPVAFELIRPQFRQLGKRVPAYPQELGPESRLMGENIDTIAATKLELSNPAAHIDRNTPPILIQHGKEDVLVPWLQSQLLADTIKKELGNDRVELDLLEGADHMDPAFETESNLNRVFAFIDKALKKPHNLFP